MNEGKAMGRPYWGEVYVLRTLPAMFKRPKANFRAAKFACKEEGAWGVFDSRTCCLS